MNSYKKLFDKDSINNIVQFVESKEKVLRDVKDFNEKEKMLSLCIEVLDSELSKENKDKFDKVIKLMYQIEEYYIALAYILGKQ